MSLIKKKRFPEWIKKEYLGPICCSQRCLLKIISLHVYWPPGVSDGAEIIQLFPPLHVSLCIMSFFSRYFHIFLFIFDIQWFRYDEPHHISSYLTCLVFCELLTSVSLRISPSLGNWGLLFLQILLFPILFLLNSNQIYIHLLLLYIYDSLRFWLFSFVFIHSFFFSQTFRLNNFYWSIFCVPWFPYKPAVLKHFFSYYPDKCSCCPWCDRVPIPSINRATRVSPDSSMFSPVTW